MKKKITFLFLLAQAALAFGSIPASGIYEITDGGMTDSNCPSVDRRTIRQLPWWVVQAIGGTSLTIREAKSYTSVGDPQELWGNITLKGGGYGLYEGSGFMTWRRIGPYGPCSLRRDIAVRVNSFSDGSIRLSGSIKTTHRNPDFEGHACELYEMPQCTYSFTYDLALIDRQR